MRALRFHEGLGIYIQYLFFGLALAWLGGGGGLGLVSWGGEVSGFTLNL